MFVDIKGLHIATQAAGVTVALIAVVLSFNLLRQNPSRRVFAMLFLALAGSELSSTAALIIPGLPVFVMDVFRAFSFSITFWIGPLLLFQVRALVGSGPIGGLNAYSLGHYVLPVWALVTAVLFLVLPEQTRAEMLDGAKFQELSLFAKTLSVSFLALEFAVYFQWMIYGAWMFREQVNHLSVVKDHFASTEGLELRWISTVATLIGLYSIACLVGFLLQLSGRADFVSEEVDSIFVLVLVFCLAIWGLRPSAQMQEAEQALKTQRPQQADHKYKKSALSSDQAERIIRKLNRAMREDHLHRDPNLTLTQLSKHIGVSTNYASQTLNEHVGQSFFDYVNGWRIKEAIPLLDQNGQTVLAIAYEVGFNSRSSFYTAFKKKTGLTPTAYKDRNTPLNSVAF